MVQGTVSGSETPESAALILRNGGHKVWTGGSERAGIIRKNIFKSR